MNTTKIEWTDFSANPLKYRNRAGQTVWACVKCSPGCAHCYACEIGHRYQRGGDFTAAEMADLDPFLDDKELHHMRTAKVIDGVPVAGKRCFIGDMTDIFGEWVPDALLNRLYTNVLEARQDVTWQVLTKRADRMQQYLAWRYGEGRIPARNIWHGVSVENQHFADVRIPLLLNTPSAIRFISYEPALGPVLLDNGEASWLTCNQGCSSKSEEPCLTREATYGRECFHGIDWVIVGGESGPGARPFAEDWARATVTACQQAGVAVFVKQMGSQLYTQYNTDSKGVFIGGCTDLSGRKTKGNDMAEWPKDLRVRQFPEGRP